MILNNTTHKNIMLRILKEIYAKTSISPFLGFKGGTAAYLFYGLNRFSVDLDFDLLDLQKKQEVFDSIKNIVQNYGKIKEARIKRFSLFFLLSYGEQTHNIKLEINTRVFDSSYEVKNYLGIPMLVMVKPDMFAHKLVAMMERKGQANRDIYDVHFFLKNTWPINKKIIEERTKEKFKNYLHKCIDHLQKMTDANILNGVGMLLNSDQKKWAKANLRKDSIFMLRLLLE